MIVAGAALALGGLLLIVATRSGHFGHPKREPSDTRKRQPEGTATGTRSDATVVVIRDLP
jgi:hypothetical protein